MGVVAVTGGGLTVRAVTATPKPSHRHMLEAGSGYAVYGTGQTLVLAVITMAGAKGTLVMVGAIARTVFSLVERTGVEPDMRNVLRAALPGIFSTPGADQALEIAASVLRGAGWTDSDDPSELDPVTRKVGALSILERSTDEDGTEDEEDDSLTAEVVEASENAGINLPEEDIRNASAAAEERERASVSDVIAKASESGTAVPGLETTEAGGPPSVEAATSEEDP